jgi:hypothetical protein
VKKRGGQATWVPGQELARVRTAARAVSRERARFRKVLAEIAALGNGIRADQLDWSNIGKIAKQKAAEALRPKCPRCGK